MQFIEEGSLDEKKIKYLIKKSKQCTSYHPDDRPTFSAGVSKFLKIIFWNFYDPNIRELSDELTDEYEKIGRQATYTTNQGFNDMVEDSFTHYEGADYEEDGYDRSI